MRSLLPVALALAAATCATTDHSAKTVAPLPTDAAPTGSPIFTQTAPAPSGSVLRVFVEPTQLVGWIAGSTSFAGKAATIELSGTRREAIVDASNTFALPYQVSSSSEATIRVGALVQKVTVEPMTTLEPTAYFVVDRPAYRPGQKLAFAAFLRRLDGEHPAPLANQRVEVRLVSQTKQTIAARLALVADGAGRISGEYTFSAGDPLDVYSLSIPGYRGSTQVTLGEYRKSKVKLDVDAAIGSREAKLTFRALDFLDGPVPGGSVTFTAQIVRDSEPAAPAQAVDPRSSSHPVVVDPLQFALGDKRGPLGTDARLWYAAHAEAPWVQPSSPRVAQVIDEIEGSVALDAKGTGTFAIPIKSEQVRGRHRVLVDATIVDANGREQRTTRSIALARSDVRVKLATADALVATGHPIDIRVEIVNADGQVVAPASATVAAVRIEPPATLAFYDDWNNANWNNGRWNHWNNGNANIVIDNGNHRLNAPSCRHTAMGCRQWQRRIQRPTARDATEQLAASVAVTGQTARLVLDDAGAYRLLASVQLADGSTVWSELGIAVRERDALPPLVLELERDEIRQGDRITGRLQGRHRNSAVLVVVRDARGMQSRNRIVTGADGQARIDLPAGDRLGFGALVEAYALVDDGEVYAAQDSLRVLPARQELAIRTNAKPTYGPGEVVELDIAVDTHEPVDLVVTAYDQSLLGVAPDHSIDPRSFYLADDRVRSRAALSALRAQLGDVTVGQILDRVRGDDAKQLHAWFDKPRVVTIHAVIALLKQAGIHATHSPYASWSMPVADAAKLRATRVIDVIARDMAALAFERVADAVVIADPRHVDVAPAALTHRGFSRGDASGNASFSAGNASYSAGGNMSYSAPAMPIDVGVATTDVVRRDFSDSAYWSANARTGADGKARVSFKLPDSLTNWRVVVTAVGRDLRVGRHTTTLRSMRDVMIWPMLPRLFTEGDVVSIFSTVHNLTDAARDITVQLDAKHVDVLSPATMTVRVPRGKSVPVTWSVRAREVGMASLLMTAKAPTGSDASMKHIPIVASAADQIVTVSGFADKPLVVKLPAGIDPKHATLELSFAPSLAADMVETLHYLVEYQYGCAEQTMSRFAPAIRVASILDNLGVKAGALRARLPGVVEASMKRLVELQQPDGGWGWHGSGATHEMITPYVVWGLIEAEKAGYKLHAESAQASAPGHAPGNAIDRGLQRIHAFIEMFADDQHLADRAYLMYVYSQRHRLLDRWWSELVEKREQLSDYALALALEIAIGRKDGANADRFATALRARAVRDGRGAYWRTASFSRWGDDPFETTAAAMKALVAYDPEDPLIAESLAYFVATKRGDRWNSTKDTAMILHAMTDLLARKGVKATAAPFVDYTITDDRTPSSAAPPATGTSSVKGGSSVHLAFPDGLVRKVVVPGTLAPTTTVRFANASPGMIVRAVLRFRKSGRDLASAGNGLRVTRQLFLLDDKGARVKELANGARVAKGAYVESVVTVTNTRNEAMRFMLIEDAKPAGAEALPLDDPRFPRVPTPWVLREDRETHVAFHHEHVPSTTTARTYLHLEMAGELVIPPAQAELMYQTTTRGHSGSFVLRVD